MRNMLKLAVVVSLCWTGQATALTTDGQTVPYAGVFGTYEIGDANRGADNGYGFSFFAGLPFGERGSLEFSYVGIQRDRDLDGKRDYKNAISLDYVYDFGFHNLSFSAALPAFKPYLLAGLAGIQEDSLGHKTYHPGLDTGGGLLVPLRIGTWDWGWAIRTEARVLAQYNDRDTDPADRQVLVDYHLQVGLQIPLSIVSHSGSGKAPVAGECVLSVVNPITGRKDCIADSDRDGVPDGADQCPETQPGVRVNERGCAADTGSDADGDGVLDGDDLCPDTASGLQVDAKGCATEQTLTPISVTFENDSAVLTGQATLTLDRFASSLSGQKNIQVAISGYTDNVGADAYNLLLSQQRAESVRQYLIGKGVEPGRMTTQGYGEASPVAPNTTPEGREANRRVEFKIALQQ